MSDRPAPDIQLAAAEPRTLGGGLERLSGIFIVAGALMAGADLYRWLVGGKSPTLLLIYMPTIVLRAYWTTDGVDTVQRRKSLQSASRWLAPYYALLVTIALSESLSRSVHWTFVACAAAYLAGALAVVRLAGRPTTTAVPER